MNGKAQIIKELNLITGMTSNDLDYMVYLLLKGGTYFSESDRESLYVQNNLPKDELEVIDMDSWFSQFK